jgi:pyruvate/2-oxoacid:ferredoxin oxidoreductase alpha subunit
MLCSNSVQEATDFAPIAQLAALESRIPFLHFFDGFRTSHELNQIIPLSDDDLRALIDETSVRKHGQRRLSPDHPVLRGTAQNPDVFFQSREAINPFLSSLPDDCAGRHGPVCGPRRQNLQAIRLRWHTGRRPHHYHDGLWHWTRGRDNRTPAVGTVEVKPPKA